MTGSVYVDDEDSLCSIPRIECQNALEESARRYWRASRMWHGRDACHWTTGEAINEIQDLQRYRGIVVPLSQRLLDQIIRQNEPSVAPIELTQ